MNSRAIKAGIGLMLTIFLVSCIKQDQNKTMKTMTNIPEDSHSYANPEEALIRHLAGLGKVTEP